MNRKCMGCGNILKDDELEHNICNRCFRLKHYGEYHVTNKDNDDYLKIINNIDSNDLVIYVTSLLNLTIMDLSKFKNVIVVLTKRDILPKSVSLDKLYNYDYKINFIDKIIISSNKNYNFDELLEKINKYKKTNNVYVVGYTNAGKSTMINKLIYNYSDLETEITTSPLPSTTLNTIEIKLNDITLIDTPGLLDDGDIVNYVSGNELKKIIPKKEIKPITYQVKGSQTIIVDPYLQIEASDIDLTFYISNNLEIKRYYKNISTNLKKHIIEVNKNDIVIKGLCFIKTNKKSVLNIYTLDNVSVFTRDSII